MASGAVMLIASFLPFYKIDASGFHVSWSAWSNALNLFPLATIIAIASVAVCAEVAVRRFTSASIPETVAGFTWAKLRFAVGSVAALTLLSYVIVLNGDSGAAKGIGLWLALLAAIAIAVSSVMKGLDDTSSAGASTGRHEPTPSDFVILGSAAVIFIASFLTLYEAKSVLGFDSSESSGVSAWGDGSFPLYTLPAILGVIMGAQVAISTFTDVRLPSRLLGFSWRDLHLVLGIWAAVIMVSFLVGNVGFSVQGEDVADVSKKIGFWLMLLAAIGLAAGAFMRDREPKATGAPAPRQAAPPPPPPPPA